VDAFRLSFTTVGVDWPEAADVMARAPLAVREPERLRRCFEQSYAACFAFAGDRLAGLGRAISDGEYQSALYDICVLPEFQGRGLGARIVRALLERLPEHGAILFAVPGKESFYEQFGFEIMTTAMGRFVLREGMLEAGYFRREKA
jgi:aralkylamine N-acetyltransferase